MIVIERRKDGLTVRGHANYADSGKDIVCAGVSTLIQTLIQSIKELTADEIQYSLSPGKVHIKFWNLSDITKALISSFFIGVKMIADEYPENVKLSCSEIPNG